MVWCGAVWCSVAWGVVCCCWEEEYRMIATRRAASGARSRAELSCKLDGWAVASSFKSTMNIRPSLEGGAVGIRLIVTLFLFRLHFTFLVRSRKKAYQHSHASLIPPLIRYIGQPTSFPISRSLARTRRRSGRHASALHARPLPPKHARILVMHAGILETHSSRSHRHLIQNNNLRASLCHYYLASFTGRTLRRSLDMLPASKQAWASSATSS